MLSQFARQDLTSRYLPSGLDRADEKAWRITRFGFNTAVLDLLSVTGSFADLPVWLLPESAPPYFFASLLGPEPDELRDNFAFFVSTISFLLASGDNEKARRGGNQPDQVGCKIF